ncbi:MAG: binding-protein-dependent transport system inner rane component [Oscillospiraceae bacterium]|nr:binding-protein-dependent transport system inner rane component [Oscillospiraceae bacterium]
MTQVSTRKISVQSEFVPQKKRQSQFQLKAHRFARNKAAVIALCFIVLLVFCAIFADYISPYDYAAQDLANKLQFPSWRHPFGTDNFGRDILSRIMRGGRISLLVSACAVSISAVAAVIIGSIAGFYGGTVDNVIMRVTDIFMSIPGMLFAMTVSAALGTGIMKTAIALGVCSIAPLVRQIRSSILLLKDQEFIEASKAFGVSNAKIIMKHIIPNTLAPLIVQISLRLGDTIMAISGLSFLGLGIQPPTPEWGNMVSAGKEYLTTFWPMVLFPGLSIMLSMLSFNLLGDGLRDALDPRMKR